MQDLGGSRACGSTSSSPLSTVPGLSYTPTRAGNRGVCLVGQVITVPDVAAVHVLRKHTHTGVGREEFHNIIEAKERVFWFLWGFFLLINDFSWNNFRLPENLLI